MSEYYDLNDYFTQLLVVDTNNRDTDDRDITYWNMFTT